MFEIMVRISKWQKKQHCRKSKFLVTFFWIKKLALFFLFKLSFGYHLRYSEDLSGFHFNFEVLCFLRYFNIRQIYQDLLY